MTNRIRRKPCYLLAEVSDRLGLSEQDIANFAAENLLTLSVMVGDLPVEEGFLYEADDFVDEKDQWVREPGPTYNHTGSLDLFPEDSWRALMDGEARVEEFRANEGLYLRVDETKKSDGLVVRKDRLLVRHEELERFESVHASDSARALPPAPSVQRGSMPRYEWDAFWSEALVSVVRDGCPPTLAEFVRRMEAWFASRGQYPDSSTIKKKLAVAWRQIAPLLRNAGS